MPKKLFIIIQSLLYILFISLDLLKISSTYIKYLTIFLCLLFVLYQKKKYKTIALFFTLLADYFLLVINKYYEIGLVLFIVTQITYLLYLRSIDKVISKKYLLVRIIIITIGIIILYLTKNNSLLNILVLIYFINLLINCLNAISTKEKLFALGLLLFISCDICVGLHNTHLDNSLISILMWIFYLPSQALIVLS